MSIVDIIKDGFLGSARPQQVLRLEGRFSIVEVMQGFSTDFRKRHHGKPAALAISENGDTWVYEIYVLNPRRLQESYGELCGMYPERMPTMFNIYNGAE